MTTSILLMNEYGFFLTVSAVVVNILIAGLVFRLAGPINIILGKTGAKTLSKKASLVLAAIAVMIVRKGIMVLIS